MQARRRELAPDPHRTERDSLEVVADEVAVLLAVAAAKLAEGLMWDQRGIVAVLVAIINQQHTPAGLDERRRRVHPTRPRADNDDVSHVRDRIAAA